MRQGRKVADELPPGSSDSPAQKGDLCEFKNWRPVALLCADYKIFAKVLANRLKSHLDYIGPDILCTGTLNYVQPVLNQGHVGFVERF